MTVQMLKAHDDGSGNFDLVRARIDQGDLVPMNIVNRGYATAVSGTSSFQLGASDGSALGVPGGWNVIVPAGTYTQGVLIQVRGFGRRFAVLAGGAVTAAANIDLFVNKQLKFSGSALPHFAGLLASLTGSEPEPTIPFADDLQDDGPHLIEVVAWPDPTLTSNFYIYDILGESRFYGGLPRRRQATHATALTFTTANGTTRQALPGGSWKNLRAIRVSNSDSATATVIIDDGTGTTAAADVFSFSVPAAAGGVNGSAVYDFGDYISTIPGWRARLAALPSTASVYLRTQTGN